MKRILIIKRGAAGDVVRTTSLLRVLDGHITWVLDEKYRQMLIWVDRILSFEEAAKVLPGEYFDEVISLEEDIDSAKLASSVKTEKLTGIFFKNGQVDYSDDSRDWFDMSLLSRFGKETANELKKKNKHTFQHWLFKMTGNEFRGERYAVRSLNNKKENIVGIEKRSGNVWPNKAWTGYDELGHRLRAAGHAVKFFEQRENICDYMEEIELCSFIISGDTLAMHLALAYNIPGIALFNCTSPDEIHDYRLLNKIVSPLLQQNFYSREYSEEVVNSIKVETVFDSFSAMIQQ